MLIALIIILVFSDLILFCFLPEKTKKIQETVRFSNPAGKFYNGNGTRGTVLFALGTFIAYGQEKSTFLYYFSRAENSFRQKFRSESR